MAREKERILAYRRNAAVLVAAVVLFLSFMIIRPFLVAILSAAVLSYIFYPVYLTILKYLPKKIRAKELGAMFTCIIIILIVLIPVTLISILLTNEIKGGYLFLQDFLRSPQWSSMNLPPFLNNTAGYLPQLKDSVADIARQLIGTLQNYIKGIPNVALSIFITIFSTYYFMKHGKDLYRFFSELVPLPKGRYTQILLRFDDLSRGMIMGQVVVGIIQGILACFGFVLLGVPNPILFSFLTAIISIIPLLGAALVWLPITIYLLIIGAATGEYWRAIALFLYGTFIISLIDNILKPKIVGERAKIHPLIILFGILGGIQLFGIPGILIGPIILTIFDVVIEIYKETL
ncbi:MAG: AI-2E family transporter [bacterium]